MVLTDQIIQTTPAQRKMVDEFQCPGCGRGHRTYDCDDFTPKSLGFPECDGFRCVKHCAGTFASGGVGRFNLGLPKGFCRVIYHSDNADPDDASNIVLFTKPPTYDKLNVAVWAMERDGFLFVRCYMPRTDQSAVHVIRKGKMKEICPNAINVDEFYDEMD